MITTHLATARQIGTTMATWICEPIPVIGKCSPKILGRTVWKATLARVSMPIHVVKFAMVLLVVVHSISTASAQTPSPAFPVGNITVEPAGSTTGVFANLIWSIHLPEGAESGDFIYFIRQRQYPDFVTMDYYPVSSSGQTTSILPLGLDGSVFELWTLRTESLEAFLLDSAFADNRVTATVTIRSEDPYFFPRTRADRPFFVDISVDGLHEGDENPEWLESVNLRRHVQSYGTSGNGGGIDRSLATLLEQTAISTNGPRTLTFPLSGIPTSERLKSRGEERFTIATAEDSQMPASALDSKFIQIWPVADAHIVGICAGQTIGPAVPTLYFHFNDLYPSSVTYAQIYKGAFRQNVVGRRFPGIGVVIESSDPANRVLMAQNYLSLFDSDGEWTMEILTETPFGTDRLFDLTFTVEGSATILANWRQHHFGSPVNSGEGADSYDFEHDGLPNLIEFAFGLDPKKADSSSMPVPRMIGDQLTISFTQPAGVGGITYGAEWSPNLEHGSWMPINNSGVQPLFKFTAPAVGDGASFMRLTVTGQ